MTSFDSLVSEYDAGRLGYANDLYNTLVSFGFSPRQAILDIGCGTGLSGGPLIENGYNLTGLDPSEPMLAAAREHYPEAKWVQGRAESLPFGEGSFGAVICGQAFHHFESGPALAEIKRVLQPNGLIAIWWKHLMSDDPVKQLRDAVAVDLGFAPLNSGWRGGFKEFYSAGFSQTAVRVIPWSTIVTLSRFLQYERSRKIVRDTFGASAPEYFQRLEGRLRETLGEGDPIMPLSYVHFLYLAKK